MKLINLSYIIILMVFSCTSCNVTKDLTGRTFSYHLKHRRIQLIFDNDSICRYVNTFQCNDIEPKYKKISIECRYRRVDQMLILKNIDCASDSCKKSNLIDIPPQESTKCFYLNDVKRNSGLSIGPSYVTDRQRYGLVPNIDIDTFYISKSHLIFIKPIYEGAYLTLIFK